MRTHAAVWVMAVWVLLVGNSASAAVWDANGGTGGDWNVAANWNPDGVPTAADFVDINDASASTPANPVVIASAAAVADNLRFGYSYTSNAGYLAISNNLTVTNKISSYRGSAGIVQTAGAVSAAVFSFGERETPLSKWELQGGTLATTGNFVLARGDNGSTCQFFQSDGTTVTVGDQFQMGTSVYTGGAGLYDMAGGTLTVTNNTQIGWKASGMEFKQSGGTANFATLGIASDWNDPGEGTMTLSDAAQTLATGDLTIGGGGVVGDTGVGMLVLDGSRTGAGTDLDVRGDFSQKNSGTLKGIIDTAAIAAASDMRLVDVTGNVTFADGAKLLPEFDSGATPTAGTWTLMTWDGSVTDNGLVLDPSTAADWSFDVDVDGKALTVTYAPEVIPEPASLVLVAMGGLVMVRRRRS